MSLELDIFVFRPFEIAKYNKQMMADYKNIGITNTLRILVGVVVYLNNVLRNKQFNLGST